MDSNSDFVFFGSIDYLLPHAASNQELIAALTRTAINATAPVSADEVEAEPRGATVYHWPTIQTTNRSLKTV